MKLLIITTRKIILNANMRELLKRYIARNEKKITEIRLNIAGLNTTNRQGLILKVIEALKELKIEIEKITAEGTYQKSYRIKEGELIRYTREERKIGETEIKERRISNIKITGLIGIRREKEGEKIQNAAELILGGKEEIKETGKLYCPKIIIMLCKDIKNIVNAKMKKKEEEVKIEKKSKNVK